MGGHFCWSCGATRPNEAYSEHNHGRYLCRACSKLDREELEYRQGLRDLYRLLNAPRRAARADDRLSTITVWIRARSEADLDACARLLVDTHRMDGYPAHWPANPATWLSARGILSAWVAERDGTIVGHVALRLRDTDAEITRLIVASDNRRHGIGGLLFDKACAEAAARGLRPSLEVVETHLEAIRLYEARGWRRIWSEPWSEAEDGRLLHRYVAPRRSLQT